METAAWLPNGVADILQKDLGGVLQPFCISGAEQCKPFWMPIADAIDQVEGTCASSRANC